MAMDLVVVLLVEVLPPLLRCLPRPATLRAVLLPRPASADTLVVDNWRSATPAELYIERVGVDARTGVHMERNRDVGMALRLRLRVRAWALRVARAQA